MATLREIWDAQDGKAVFDNAAGTVSVFKAGNLIAEMPQRFFPLREVDFDREVVYKTVDLNDDGNTQTYATLKGRLLDVVV